MAGNAQATNDVAFELPRDRFAWYTGAVLNKYEPAVLDKDGNLVPATTTTLTNFAQFMGICQYPAEKAGNMATVVKGAFPVVANGAIAAGSLVEVTDATITVNDIEYHVVRESDVPYSGDMDFHTVIGTALTAATTAGDLLTIAIK
jgi:hypothetical protein